MTSGPSSSGCRSAAKLLTKDEAQRIAANIAKLPELPFEEAGLVSILPISFDVPDEIADEFDLIGIIVRNLHAYECIFDQYHQLEAIVAIHPEFTEVRFICNFFGLNT